MNSKVLKKAVQYSPVVMANGMNALRQYGHIKTGMRISKPSMIYATIAERCNLRCKYCYSWMTTGENELSTDIWRRSFDELLSWTKNPKLNISGGEPFMRKDIFELLEFVVKKGALTGVVSNGYTMTPKMAPRVVGLGLTNINISIDSLDPPVFDLMRADGREGHTPRVIESILRVMSEIREQGSDMKVFLKTVVCGPNADSLVPLVNFVMEHGITGIIFQPLNHIFGDFAPEYTDDWYKNTELWPDDPQPLEDVSHQLLEMKNNGAPIMNTDAQLASWGDYFRDPINGVGGQLGSELADPETHTACHIGHTHLYLGANGDIQLCWDYPKIGNIAQHSIPERWVSDEAEALRKQIAQCTKPCTVSCLLDRGMTDTVKTFVKLVAPNNHSKKN